MSYLLKDSQAKFVVTEQQYFERFGGQAFTEVQPRLIAFDPASSLFEKQSLDNPDSEQTGVKSHDLAYVIYTSGSTGQPKGVMVEHRNLVQKLTTIANHYRLCDEDTMLLFASLSFDASVSQLFAPLIVGASVVIRPAQMTDAVTLMEYLVQQKVSVVHLVPEYLTLLLEQDERLSKLWTQSNLHSVICGGDVLTSQLANHWQSLPFTDDVALYNSYGPTETTVTAASHLYNGEPVLANSVAIGKGLPDSEFYVVNEQLQLLPCGAVGELLIGGAGVARGYLNNPELSAQQFIDNPFVSGGARLYKSGDLVRRNNQGELVFVSRKDQQVKLRGYRIEPGEIEARLLSCEQVKACAVVLRQEQQDGQSNDKSLLACLVLNEQNQDIGQVAAYLESHAPAYMIPDNYIALSELPLSISGKIDRPALVRLPLEKSKAKIGAPRNEVEQQIYDFWLALLKVDSVALDENFFMLGGHSLLATRLASQIRKHFEVNFTLRSLFELKTIEQQAQYVDLMLAEKNAVATTSIDDDTDTEEMEELEL